MPTNQAVWIKGPKAYPLELGPAPFPTPRPGEVNPVEWKVQEQDLFIKDYPFILGADVAGYITDLGDGVTHLRKGKHVIGCEPLLPLLSELGTPESKSSA
ncbi:Uncharacterized protein HZ326_20412 [Fusarium oxysporum f. sp. albedinis]|nr:Uncharacterized protein HZ326_20412 [Fusarium oxysporum f. sp. albedinis]